MFEHEDSELIEDADQRDKRRSARYQYVKEQVFHAINDPLGGNVPARIYAIFSFVLILANVFLVLYEVQYSDDASLVSKLTPLDVFSVAFFGLDYCLRIWTADLLYTKRTPGAARLRYIFSAMGLIDLISFLPSIIPVAVPLDLRVVKSIRLIRVFRILKVTRYMEGFASIRRMFRDWGNQMLSSFIILLLFIVIAAVLMFGVEHGAQPDKFDSVVTALYWAVSTITSTGFGDIAPITPLGRLFGTIIMILSIALIAIPAGILSAGFVEESRRIHLQNLLGDRSQIRKAVAMGDYDALTTDDEDIDDEDDTRNDHVYCPYCGHDLGDLNDDDDMTFCPYCGHRFRNEKAEGDTQLSPPAPPAPQCVDDEDEAADQAGQDAPSAVYYAKFALSDDTRANSDEQRVEEDQTCEGAAHAGPSSPRSPRDEARDRKPDAGTSGQRQQREHDVAEADAHADACGASGAPKSDEKTGMTGVRRCVGMPVPPRADADAPYEGPAQIGVDLSSLLENPETRKELKTFAGRIRKHTDLDLQDVIQDSGLRSELQLAADEISKGGLTDTRHERVRTILHAIEEDRLRRNSERSRREEQNETK